MRSCHQPYTAVTMGVTAAPHIVPSAPQSSAPPTVRTRNSTAQISAARRLRREAPRACRPMLAAVADALADDVHHLRDDQRDRSPPDRAEQPGAEPLGHRQQHDERPRAARSTVSPPLTSMQNSGRCRGERRSTRAASGMATRDIPRNKIVIGPNSVYEACTAPSEARPRMQASAVGAQLERERWPRCPPAGSGVRGRAAATPTPRRRTAGARRGPARARQGRRCPR